MPNLGDYLGQLLSEITTARMHADLEAVRVAELYASHPLLRNMPVPHFRLPEVELDVPVVIKEAQEPRADETARGGVQVAELRKAFNRLLKEHLSRESITPSEVAEKKLKLSLDARAEAMTQPSDVAIDVHRIADDFSKTAANILRADGPVETSERATRFPKMEDELKVAARLEFLKLRKSPPRLQVMVLTKEIREAGPSEVITHIKLKLNEQGFEWTSIEAEGGTQPRLIPE